MTIRPNHLPRTVGGFTVNFCRNALCPLFAVSPALTPWNPGSSTGGLRGNDEQCSYLCKSCGQTSTLKSNTALVQEYARLHRSHRRTKREYCANPECVCHGLSYRKMPSAYRAHGKTPKGDPRFQCKTCERTFSIGSPTRRHTERTQTGEIMRLLVNTVPLRRIREIADVPTERLYNRINFLAEQCRRMAGHKEAAIAKAFEGRNRAIATDVQMILANWRHRDHIATVPIYHAVSVEAESGYAMAATTDYDPETDPEAIEREMLACGDFNLPRAWRKHARTWSFTEYEDSLIRGARNQPPASDEEVKMWNYREIPGTGSRIRGDMFQTAHMMLVKKLIGPDFRGLLFCIDGDAGLARLTCAIHAKDIIAGRVNVAEIRFAKSLGNAKREKLVRDGEVARAADIMQLGHLVETAKATYGLQSDTVSLIAARLLRDYGPAHSQLRGGDLAEKGFLWRYHRKEEPEKVIRLLTDRDNKSFKDIAIMLTRSTMAPVDQYFNFARRRVKASERGTRPVADSGSWYANAYYDPAMIGKVGTILRFYYNFMLPESEDTGIPKADRRTPAMRLGIAKGRVYMRDLLRFG